MLRILCDRDRKTLKCQIHSRLSVQVLLPVESSLPAAVAPGLGGNRWEVQNSDGGVEDQLQLPGEKKETIKGLEERGVCV